MEAMIAIYLLVHYVVGWTVVLIDEDYPDNIGMWNLIFWPYTLVKRYFNGRG